MDNLLNKDKLWNKVKKYLYYIIFLLTLLIFLLFYLVILNKQILKSFKYEVGI
jgi:hypothetical protein